MLDGKIALVTGSAGGIGRGTAIEMARQGRVRDRLGRERRRR